jgi:hypothetical protein
MLWQMGMSFFYSFSAGEAHKTRPHSNVFTVLIGGLVQITISAIRLKSGGVAGKIVAVAPGR